MDTLRGKFADEVDPADDRTFDADDEALGLDRPASPVGDDERRMQVRAYNHWASLIQDRNFPSIDELHPGDLPDFGPCSVLLDFSYGTENPGIAYLGDRLAAECDATDVEVNMLSDVPARSLLSRITDHYMQILSNQAPIGFEAEFVNYTGRNVLYRGILLPYSSDDDQIDFILGVINWTYLADQQTTDELMLEIDQALEDETTASPLVRPAGWSEDTEHADGEWTAGDQETEGDSDEGLPSRRNPIVHGLTPMGKHDSAEDDPGEDDDLPVPSFGWTEDDEEEGDGAEDDGEFQVSSPLPDPLPDPLPSYSPLMSKAKTSRPVFPLAGPESSADEMDEFSQDNDAEEFDAEYSSFHDDDEETRLSGAGYGHPHDEPVADEPEHGEFAGQEEPESIEYRTFEADEEAADAFQEAESAPDEPVHTAASAPEPGAELSAELAAARELADNARDSEDRTRHALYEAIGKAYDFSLAAAEAPAEFEALIAEAGLTMQERAPMTPVVKLVFGADYDKTRITEYAAALAHAHRHHLERGELARFIDSHAGGLKGVVQAERHLRREEAGQPAETAQDRIARQLRALPPVTLDTIPSDGAEFALVMIRRDEAGEVVLLGEVPEDSALVERAARKLLG